jgi:hypothetical protein
VTVAEGDAAADAPPQQAVRVRGISTPDAIAVTFIAAAVGVFIQPHTFVGYLLVGAMGLMYGAYRVTRGLPMRHRLLVTLASFIAPLVLALWVRESGE